MQNISHLFFYCVLFNSEKEEETEKNKIESPETKMADRNTNKKKKQWRYRATRK